MFKTMVFVMVGAVFALSSSALASDPCKTVLCLYGKATGNSGGSECRSAEKDFFNIINKKKKSIRWNETFNARKGFLLQCQNVDSGAIDMIMNKYGKSLA